VRDKKAIDNDLQAKIKGALDAFKRAVCRLTTPEPGRDHASLKSIKKRISSTKSTRQITKAMKMVSAAKLRRAQEAVVAARPFSNKLQQVIASLARARPGRPPAARQRGKGKALIVLVTSDRGLCGGFNGNVSKAVERHIRSNPTASSRSTCC